MVYGLFGGLLSFLCDNSGSPDMNLFRTFFLSLCLAPVCLPVQAWVLAVTPGIKAVYLAVGNLSANADNSTVNRVSLDLPATAIASGTPQVMNTINSASTTQVTSPYDNYSLCTPASGQVYVGGFYRLPATNSSMAVLQVSTPGSLTSGAFNIPFSQISWTSSAAGNAAADIPPGTFLAGGTLFLRNIVANSFVENCHTFRYANTQPVGAGVYDGRATYTLTAP